jgi:broad specificity phosphatase PhoE
MKKITFIRHAEKEYNNNRGPLGCFQHDPDIYPFDSSISEKIYTDNKFDLVITSPFKRTRHTSRKILNDLNLNLQIIVDNDISEYLGFQKPVARQASISQQTKEYIKPLLGVEKIKDLKKRLSIFYEKLSSYHSNNILVVTHGINISFFYQIIYGKKIEKKPGTLEGFTFELFSYKNNLI